jgi:hypothetical protein
MNEAILTHAWKIELTECNSQTLNSFGYYCWIFDCPGVRNSALNYSMKELLRCCWSRVEFEGGNAYIIVLLNNVS